MADGIDSGQEARRRSMLPGSARDSLVSAAKWGFPIGSVLLFAVLPLATPVAAQSKSVVVERRDGDIIILENGDVQVIETWKTRFIGGPFRFAFRVIPLSRVEAIDSWVPTDLETYREEGAA